MANDHLTDEVIQQAAQCDIVAFAAHPDDVELNCAGTLALAVKQGRSAGIVDFCRGELGTRGTPEIRDEEAARSAKVLGLSSRINLRLPDGSIRDTDESRALVVRTLRRMRPQVVIAPSLTDHHADHMAVAEILQRSFYLAGVAKYAPGDPAWRPRALLHYCGSAMTTPSIVVDISAVYQQRVDAALCYESQFYNAASSEPPTRIAHPDFLDAIEGRARHFGMTIGVKYGEGYTMREPIPTTDIVGLLGTEPWTPPGEKP